MEIGTRRLLLRRARETDLEAVHAYMGDRRVMQYWSTAPHPDRDHTRIWLENMIAAPTATSEDYLIELNGRVIGEAGSNPLPEFGFILHRDYWGQGLAYEASRAVVRNIFKRRPIDTLTADVDPRNAGSIGLLRKLGFRQNGEAKRTFFVNGEWVDSLYFRLDRPASRLHGGW